MISLLDGLTVNANGVAEVFCANNDHNMPIFKADEKEYPDVAFTSFISDYHVNGFARSHARFQVCGYARIRTRTKLAGVSWPRRAWGRRWLSDARKLECGPGGGQEFRLAVARRDSGTGTFKSHHLEGSDLSRHGDPAFRQSVLAHRLL